MTLQPPTALKQWNNLVLTRATACSLDPFVLAALIWRESSGDPMAARSEPGFTWFFDLRRGPLHDSRLTIQQNRDKALAILGEQEFNFQSSSHGLTQCMGSTFRELGFVDSSEDAYSPDVNIEYGARYLALCVKRAHGDLEGGLLRFNGGGRPQYPAEVLERAEVLRNL